MNSVNQSSFKKCPKCQTVAAIDAPVCVICGHQFRTQFTANQGTPDPTQAFTPIQPQQPYGYPVQNSHSPGIAALLTFVLLGAGQMYNGQVAKGFLFLATAILFGCLFWPISLVIWVVGLVDAIMVGDKKQKGQFIDQWQFF